MKIYLGLSLFVILASGCGSRFEGADPADSRLSGGPRRPDAPNPAPGGDGGTFRAVVLRGSPGFESSDFDANTAGDAAEADDHMGSAASDATFRDNASPDSDGPEPSDPPETGAVGELDTWLAAHPALANAIVWRQPFGPVNGTPIAYPQWSQADKKHLSDVFWKIRTGGEAVLSATPAHTDNLDNAGEIFSTMIDPATAWEIYIAHVAQSLAVEHASWVPWSVAGAPAAELSLLFDSESLFNFSTATGTYHIVSYHPVLSSQGSATPGDPVRTFRFLTTNNLLGTSSLATIEQLLEWCRSNMAHFFGSLTPANCAGIWQYDGYPPVERIISGTTDQSSGFNHWTAGCWGTVGFLRAVLRTANVAVKLVHPCTGHAQPHFVHDDRYLSHGDDPYNQWSKSPPQFPITSLLLDHAGFDTLFTAVPDPCANVGRGVPEAAIVHPPYFLLKAYCADQAANKDHASGTVLQLFQPWDYTLAVLEGRGLWTNMDAAIAALGGCANVPEFII